MTPDEAVRWADEEIRKERIDELRRELLKLAGYPEHWIMFAMAPFPANEKAFQVAPVVK